MDNNVEKNIREVLDDDGVEDYNTLKTDADGETEENYPNITIKIEREQYSVFEMLRKYHNDKICLDPSFQRNFVWTRRQMSELIESVVMGIPLPLIYLAENRDGKMIVVDGRQRLTTFVKFLDNEFKLEKLKILNELNGKKFKDIENEYPKYAATIEDYQLMIQVIKHPTPDRIRFDIFDRVNRGGTPLNKQEMRNALYQGKATILLDNITKLDSFKNATGRAISDRHMKDKYIVLRAIAFCMVNEKKLVDSNGTLVDYRSDMDDLMGKVMDSLNHMQDSEIDWIFVKFDRVMKEIYSLLGEDAFRLKGNNETRRPISMTLFETLYYLFYLLDEKQYDVKRLVNKIDELLSDATYLFALQRSVDSATNVKVRFDKVKCVYEEISND
ncbi:Protein of unknown function DUF262 [Butyrivibrio sp. INlla18]|uniref:DUF262 domain-containing protein n=1 Tax=Butyrivibrio sp. INlla18 TaxID=1520806 RepID=UPI00088B0EE9|nr:DUF262 domain-containing protein [Butyrivibrio sp. INlla18]SDA73124.1 Protein of unknown function DUF262 [Butyrivibrio sp. INlla18]